MPAVVRDFCPILEAVIRDWSFFTYASLHSNTMQGKSSRLAFSIDGRPIGTFDWWPAPNPRL